MELTTQDYLKKALLDTQERVRDFMNYAEKIEGEELRQFFRECAQEEGYRASDLQEFLKNC